MQGTEGIVQDKDIVENKQDLIYLMKNPQHFSFQTLDQLIDESVYQKKVQNGETDPEEDYVHEVDLDDKTHGGAFAGGHRFTQCREHKCLTCGFQCSNSTFFTLVDCAGQCVRDRVKSTDEYMVTQLSQEIDYLCGCTKDEIANLGKKNSRQF